jgi:rubrerythrin
MLTNETIPADERFDLVAAVQDQTNQLLHLTTAAHQALLDYPTAADFEKLEVLDRAAVLIDMAREILRQLAEHGDELDRVLRATACRHCGKSLPEGITPAGQPDCPSCGRNS